jgi:hypothetical protein
MDLPEHYLIRIVDRAGSFDHFSNLGRTFQAGAH